MRDHVTVILGPVPRTTRAALFALVCASVGAVMHQAADGCAVSWPGILLGFAAVCPGAYLLLGAERSGPALTGALAVNQLGLHFLFCAFCVPMNGAATPVTTAASAGAAWAKAMAQMPAGVSMPMSMPMSMQMPMSMSLPGGTAAAAPDYAAVRMIAAHALAVLVTGWWLRQGERALFALLRAAALLCEAPLRRLAAALAALCSAAAPIVLPSGSGVPRRAWTGLVPRPAPLPSSVTFRGPPVAAV